MDDPGNTGNPATARLYVVGDVFSLLTTDVPESSMSVKQAVYTVHHHALIN